MAKRPIAQPGDHERSPQDWRATADKVNLRRAGTPERKPEEAQVFGRRPAEETERLRAKAAAEPLPTEVYDEASGQMKRPTGRARDGKFTFERGE